MKTRVIVDGKKQAYDLMRTHIPDDLLFGDRVLLHFTYTGAFTRGKVVGVFEKYITVEISAGRDKVDWVKVTAKHLYMRVYKIIG